MESLANIPQEEMMLNSTGLNLRYYPKHTQNLKHTCYIIINFKPSVSVTCICVGTRASQYIIDPKSAILKRGIREYFNSEEKENFAKRAKVN